MTLDVDRGLVFAGTGSATSDFYGADRKGRNLYANSLLALDANTGKLVWFQQLVHHDIWDWDLPAAPTLIEVTKNGRRIPAVAQMTKMSTLFIFDRRNGEPVFGMEERQVPQTDLPGEETSPTQPFPLRPAPLSRTTFDPATDLYVLTPEHAKYLPGPLGRQQDVHARDVHAADGRSNDGDVSEHARRRQLERPLARSRARPVVHEHHEPRPGRPHGEARRRRRWSRASRHG